MDSIWSVRVEFGIDRACGINPRPLGGLTQVNQKGVSPVEQLGGRQGVDLLGHGILHHQGPNQQAPTDEGRQDQKNIVDEKLQECFSLPKSSVRDYRMLLNPSTP
jgi:hypothetical protein